MGKPTQTKKTEGILCKKNVWIAIGLQAVSLVILIVIVASFANFTSANAKKMFHWGPSVPNGIQVNVFGINVDSAVKYGMLIGWIILSECLATWSYKIYKNWYRNKLLDPKSSDVGVSDGVALTMVNLWSVITFVPRIFKYLLVVVTGMIQFLIPGFLARRVVSSIVDAIYLKEKKTNVKHRSEEIRDILAKYKVEEIHESYSGSAPSSSAGTQ